MRGGGHGEEEKGVEGGGGGEEKGGGRRRRLDQDLPLRALAQDGHPTICSCLVIVPKGKSWQWNFKLLSNRRGGHLCPILG